MRRFDKNGEQIHKINPDDVLFQRTQNPEDYQWDGQAGKIICTLFLQVNPNLCRLEEESIDEESFAKLE